MTRTAPNRPQTIAEIAQRAKAHTQDFDAAVREFLDQWQSMAASERRIAISQEPVRTGRIHDAYLAALAEHLALSDRIEVPAWVQQRGSLSRHAIFCRRA